MRWICTVCKYEHEGDEPPDICPVCKKGKEFFEPAEAPESTGEPEEEPAEEPGETRSWYCTVCKYVHQGDGPPDICPVCKKPWDKFVPHVDGEPVLAGPPAGATPAPAPAEAVKADRWRCVVCNHIHDGSAPPDICPVCGKGKEFFQPETAGPEHSHEGLAGLVEKMHLHPVTAHFPNGSLPLALVAWVAYLVTGEGSLERTAFYLTMIAVVVSPVTFFSGWSDAKHRFGSTTTGVFPEKKLWSWVLMAVITGLAPWRLAVGWDVAPDTTAEIAIYSSFLLLGNALVARLGMLGGKLVFGH